MRSDFERILKLFVNPYNSKLSDAKYPMDEFYIDCNKIIVGDSSETIDAMVLSELILFDSFPEHQGGGEYFKLTEKGISQLKKIYNVPDENGDNSISETDKVISELKTKIENSEFLDNNLKSLFLDTLFEIETTYKIKCYNASISMCGKLLETFLSNILTIHNIKYEIDQYDRNGRPKATRMEPSLKELIDIASNHKFHDKRININKDLVNLIRYYRNGLIHFSKDYSKPTENQLSLIIVSCLEVVNQHFSLLKL